MKTSKLKELLEELYDTYNRREYVHPDPLEFLYRFDNQADREIVGMLASALAYGRVAQILKSVERALERIPTPASDLKSATRKSLVKEFAGFKHRFTDGPEVASLLWGIKSTIESYGSLEKLFLQGQDSDDETVLPALGRYMTALQSAGGTGPCFSLPVPQKGGACKRAHLFLRWMIRHDDVDPGGWDKVPASKLVVPIDTHMHKIGLALGLTTRKQANMKAALEITKGFRKISPDDPVKYDFALTRFGIRGELSIEDLVRQIGGFASKPPAKGH